MFPGRSPCVINCRAGTTAVAAADPLAARSALRSPAVLNPLSHSICSLSSRICISAPVNEAVALCLVFWQIPGYTNVLVDKRAFFFLYSSINIDKFEQAHSMCAMRGSDKIGD